MTVKELIKQLSQFPDDMEVLDACYEEIEYVYESTWTHSNYPYNKPDKQGVLIS